MPVPYLKKLHEKTGKPMSELEQLWDECKKQATAADKDEKNYWSYVVFLLKKRLGLTEGLSFREFIDFENPADEFIDLPAPLPELPALPSEPLSNVPTHVQDLPPAPEHAQQALTVRNLVSGLFHIRDQAHALHLSASSFAAHMALGELYEKIVDLADDIAETTQGKYGVLAPVTGDGMVKPSTAGDPRGFIAEVATWIEGAHAYVPSHDTFLHNLVDEVQALVYRVKYKLDRFN